MNTNILKYLKGYSYNEQDVNRLLVSSFIKLNNILHIKNKFIRSFLINEENKLEYEHLKCFTSLFNSNFDIELLIELFEFIISPEDKEINGAVFTPEYIRKYIVEQVLNSFEIKYERKYIDSLKIADIACGCGGFFKTIAEEYRKRIGKTFFDIYKENIFGIDIKEYSITRTKILLILYAIINGEDREYFEFNLFEGNTLDFNWSKIPFIRDSSFDAIVGNPPYVGSSNLDDYTKMLMRNWSVSSTGKLDLYIPFFQIGLDLLKNNGILGYITVNNFYRSLNGRALRKFFSEGKYNFRLIDFGSEQVFKSRLTYTCICLIERRNGDLAYTNTNPHQINKLMNNDFIIFDYKNLNDIDGWQLESAKVKLNLQKLETAGKKLGELFDIKNGFATLRNNIYIFSPISEDDIFFYFKKGDVIVQIEKDICRDVIKPNILKTEFDLDNFMEKIIFPYEIIQNNKLDSSKKTYTKLVKVIEEDIFRHNYPKAYEYLCSQKDELAKRDKGQRKYDTWYAYGRSQALTISGLKLLFPYMSDAPYFVYTDDKELLFYNGYSLISNSECDLKFVQKILKNKVFWYYIKKTSKPYSNNYFALSKSYIKNFSIPYFSEKEKYRFMRLKKESYITRFLIKKYNITDIEF
ncbi:Eco57I restriction-modification methylase domain-containing protein [Otariodibacter oris]|uniref:site-specific DNA-methyltransferase (adenine-specific) n=1 Tax=Otariodibacter oris TaxID=1032623 RepID=A0A420XGU3_9PAST|nr:N-6 DNA methylase [Otariodibacter oris]QGM81190.1 hypothetical protein A6A10_07105 [Otariodibacter oris]RKR72748.1 Eco57I restriction-modification methylase [Otariodibacter oris]